MAVGNKRSQLDSLIQNAWLARHSNPTPQLMDSFLGSVQDALNDVLSGGEVEFFDFKRESDHEIGDDAMVELAASRPEFPPEAEVSDAHP